MASESPSISHPSELSDQNPPEFDPSEPSIPISYPLKSLEDLESRSYFSSFHYPFNKASVPLESNSALPNRRRILVCHDMAGGYLDDKWVQGDINADGYAIWHWYLMDVFVYFSHNLVTLPPPCWVNAAHKHGVKVLGTFITEGDAGRTICDKLLSTKESAHTCAERLSELAIALGFDGWLINMEVKLTKTQIPALKEFVSHLTETMHSSKPGSLVIWYDSVTVQGDLNWQNQLNDNNKAFFDLCDGIFTNYLWEEDFAKLSATVAGDRKFDVYMGIDVFGRGTFGGGKWNTNVALDVIRKDDVSAAIFAPGWVYETKQPPEFQTAQNRWWALIEKSWGLMQNYPTSVPFYSDFDQGRGHHLSVGGKQISNVDWYNLSCQSFQPFLEYSEDHGLDDIQAIVNLSEGSYSGGGNVAFRGDLGNQAYVTKRLFQAKLPLGDPVLHFTYSVKSDGDSLLGLSLDFSSVGNGRASVFLASHGDAVLTMNQFSSKYSKVIMPHRVTKLESIEWILQENAVAMPGHTLTEIRAVCYKLKPEIDEAHSIDHRKKKSGYHAILGHLSVQTPGHNVIFPPSSSWLVDCESIKWESGSVRVVSITILWRLKDGNDLSEFQNYRIYVEKISEADANLAGNHQGQQEYLGLAQVEAFYVSELPVPSGTTSLKFIIQVCGVDGTSQQLDDSPTFQLDVQAPNTL